MSYGICNKTCRLKTLKRLKLTKFLACLAYSVVVIVDSTGAPCVSVCVNVTLLYNVINLNTITVNI